MYFAEQLVLKEGVSPPSLGFLPAAPGPQPKPETPWTLVWCFPPGCEALLEALAPGRAPGDAETCRN